MNYWEFNFRVSPKMPWADILMAELAELGFDSFVESEDGLLAYIPEQDCSDELLEKSEFLQNKPQEVEFSFQKQFIPAQNWNATWESSFEPVQVGEDLVIVAPFHQDYPKTKYTIVIEPKMSFGTGHHQTTRLMSKALLELDKMPACVLDMGCGTGVLAILAEKLGAQEITGIDIEEWAYENAIENAERNDCSRIKILHGDSHLIRGAQFDLIIANINKNVLLADMEQYSKCLTENGLLFLSGFFVSDNENLLDCAKKYNLAPIKSYSDEQWSCLVLKKF